MNLLAAATAMYTVVFRRAPFFFFGFWVLVVLTVAIVLLLVWAFRSASGYPSPQPQASAGAPGQFKISGVDRVTKQDRVWRGQADSAANARVKAELDGIIVTAVERE